MRKVLREVLLGTALGLMSMGVTAQQCGPGGQLTVVDGTFGLPPGFCYYNDNSCSSHPAGQFSAECIDRWKRKSGNEVGNSGGSKPPPLLPSKWGAVAWNDQTGNYDTSLGERSKAEAVDTALRKCGSGCETIVIYANQCVAVALGLLSDGYGFRRQGLDINRRQAEQKALAACNAEAKNCQILFTECSLP